MFGVEKANFFAVSKSTSYLIMQDICPKNYSWVSRTIFIWFFCYLKFFWRISGRRSHLAGNWKKLFSSAKLKPHFICMDMHVFAFQFYFLLKLKPQQHFSLFIYWKLVLAIQNCNFFGKRASWVFRKFIFQIL